MENNNPMSPTLAAATSIDHHLGNPDELLSDEYGIKETRGSLTISNVLNNPASRSFITSPNLATLNPLRSASGPKTANTRGPKTAPPVQFSDIPQVSYSDLQPYLDEVSDAWSRFETNRKRRDQIKKQAPPRIGGSDDQQQQQQQQDKENENKNKNELDGNTPEIPSLNHVPSLFFDPTFDLTDPKTFDLVSPPNFQPYNPSTSTSTSTEIDPSPEEKTFHDALSHQLDIVELHLANEISRRASSFFSALSNLQSLSSQSSMAISQISNLRSELENLDQNFASKGLELIHTSRQRRQLINVINAVDRAKDISKALNQAEELSAAGEWMDALRLSDELLVLWNHDPSTVTAKQQKEHHEQEQANSDSKDNSKDRKLSAIGEEEEEEEEEEDGEEKDAEGEGEDDNKTITNDAATGTTSTNAANDMVHLPFKLSEVGAFKSLPHRVASIRSAISVNLRLELVTLLTHELHARMTIGIKSKQLTPQVKTDLSQDAKRYLMDRTKSLIYGLVRCGPEAVREAIEAWRDSMINTFRLLVREGLPLGNAPTTQSSAVEEDDALMRQNSSSPSEGGSTTTSSPSSVTKRSADLAKNLRQISHENFLQIIKDSFHQCLIGLLIVNAHSEALFDLLKEAATSEENKSTLTPTTAKFTAKDGNDNSNNNIKNDSSDNNSKNSPDELIFSWESDLLDSIDAISDVTYSRLAKILSVRSEQHSKLELIKFYQIFDAAWNFVLEGEKIGRKMLGEMRSTVVSQAKEFLLKFHIDHVTKSARLVEEEQWTQAEVSTSVQNIINLIAEASISDPKEFILDKNESDPTTTTSSSSTSISKTLLINDNAYTTVAACLCSIELLSDYLRVVVNIPLLTPDVMPRVIEFLKQFNSRTCQVVLGAGAMRSAGLKNITAKHLALSSQTLSVIIALVPYVREALRRHLPPKQAVMLVEFDKLRRDCQEHQYEIHAKLVAIMSERLDVHCKTLATLDWTKRFEEGRTINQYMETLVKETTTLFKVLSKYLLQQAFESVLEQVFKQMRTRLLDEYGRINLETTDSKQRMLADVKYLSARLSELKGLEMTSPGPEIEKMVQDKEVAEEIAAAKAEEERKAKEEEERKAKEEEEKKAKLEEERTVKEAKEEEERKAKEAKEIEEEERKAKEANEKAIEERKKKEKEEEEEKKKKEEDEKKQEETTTKSSMESVEKDRKQSVESRESSLSMEDKESRPSLSSPTKSPTIGVKNRLASLFAPKSEQQTKPQETSSPSQSPTKGTKELPQEPEPEPEQDIKSEIKPEPESSSKDTNAETEPETEKLHDSEEKDDEIPKDQEQEKAQDQEQDKVIKEDNDAHDLEEKSEKDDDVKEKDLSNDEEKENVKEGEGKDDVKDEGKGEEKEDAKEEGEGENDGVKEKEEVQEDGKGEEKTLSPDEAIQSNSPTPEPPVVIAQESIDTVKNDK